MSKFNTDRNAVIRTAKNTPAKRFRAWVKTELAECPIGAGCDYDLATFTSLGGAWSELSHGDITDRVKAQANIVDLPEGTRVRVSRTADGLRLERQPKRRA